MIYQYQCPYCKGRGYHYLERGCSLTYICEDCKGSGELARCDDCGDKNRRWNGFNLHKNTSL